MALTPGTSRRIVRENVTKLTAEGYPHKTAVAIALRHAGRSRKRRKKPREASPAEASRDE